MASESAKKKMSDAAKARCTDEWKIENKNRLRTKIDDAFLILLYEGGATQSECAQNLKVSRKVVENAMKRLGIKPRKAAKRDQTGPKNHMWKGLDANLVCKHRRLYRAFGQPSKCDVCGTQENSKTYDWANLTGDYDNPQDFKRMCRSCHAKYDNKIQNITNNKKEGL